LTDSEELQSVRMQNTCYKPHEHWQCTQDTTITIHLVVLIHC